MSGSRSGASEKFAEQSLVRSRKAFETGYPLLQRGMGMANRVIEGGGEPGYLASAIDASTANAQDAAMMDEQAQRAAFTLGNKAFAEGGNFRGFLAPESIGAKMAGIVAQSGVGRQNARIAQVLEAAGVSLGGAGGAADAQTRMFSNELGAISMRPIVSPGYAAAVGAANAAGTIYGGLDKAGVFGRPNSSQVGTGEFAFGTSGPYVSSMGGPAMGGDLGRRSFTLGSGAYGPPPTGYGGWSGNGWR